MPDEEMAYHIDRITDELIEAGLPPDAAREAALTRFGDPGAVREACRRDERRVGMVMLRIVDAVRQDLSFAMRQLVRGPLVNGLALVTLALRIGATTVVFSLVHAVVLQPLPFPEPDRLVRVSQTSPQGRPYSMSEANFVDFHARQRTLVEMAGVGFGRPVLSGEGWEAESLEGLRVSHTFFPLLGLEPLVGRTFRAAEDVKDGPNRVLMLSESTWERRFGRDPSIVGRMLTLDGTSREVVGVVPSDRAWPGVEVFTPLSPEPEEERDDQVIESFGRLAALRIDPDVPAMSPAALWDDLQDRVAWPRFTMQILTAFSLATVTLAGLGIYGVTAFSVRRRQREIGLRVALGAEPGSVVALVLARALRLALMGIGLGLLLALVLSRFMVNLLFDVSPHDPLTFGAVSALLGTVALVAAWVPARRAVRISPRDAMMAE